MRARRSREPESEPSFAPDSRRGYALIQVLVTQTVTDGATRKVYEAGRAYVMPGHLVMAFLKEGWGRAIDPAPPQERPISVAYLHSSPPICGSAYKYGEMFRRIVGGTIVAKPSDHERFVTDHRPDLIICRGDRRSHHETALRHHIPYILIANDLQGAREGAMSDEEKRALTGAASILFVSEQLRAWAAERCPLPPSEVVPLRPLRDQLAFAPLAKLPGKNLVYAGNLIRPVHAADVWGYRAIDGVLTDAQAARWTVHLYSHAAMSVLEAYEKLGCVLHEPVPERYLPRELSKYQAGLQAYAYADGYVALSQPNKTWLYLAAGIPTIGVNTGPCGRIYDGKWGVVLDSTSQFRSVKLPEIDQQQRFSEVMDTDEGKFRALIDAALS
jgi:hypothetical protein